MVDKKNMLFHRDGAGVLIPQEIELESLNGKPMVKIVPLIRGDLQMMMSKIAKGTDEEKIAVDNEVIMKGLCEPKFTEKEVKDLRPEWAVAIVNAIVSVSTNVPQKDLNKRVEDVVKDQEFLHQKK